MEGEKMLYLCSHREYWASVWEQGCQQLQRRFSSWEGEMGSLNVPPMVPRRGRPSLIPRESPRGDTLRLERQITEPMQTHESAPTCFWGEADASPVQCMCSLSLSLCPAHPGLCNEGCCGCCPGKGLGKDSRGWHGIEGSGAGLKFRGKKL